MYTIILYTTGKVSQDRFLCEGRENKHINYGNCHHFCKHIKCDYV